MAFQAETLDEITEGISEDREEDLDGTRGCSTQIGGGEEGVSREMEKEQH